jgi:predicted dehydrogenase
MQRSLKGFRDWVLEEVPFLIPGAAALPALRVVEGIYQSAKEGKVVRIIERG